jgi:hypothetical protein
MNGSAAALALGLLVSPVLTPTAMAQSASPAITEEAARAIAVDAYLYFYPIISVDITRKQSTNIEPGKLTSVETQLGRGGLDRHHAQCAIKLRPFSLPGELRRKSDSKRGPLVI